MRFLFVCGLFLLFVLFGLGCRWRALVQTLSAIPCACLERSNLLQIILGEGCVIKIQDLKEQAARAERLAPASWTRRQRKGLQRSLRSPGASRDTYLRQQQMALG